MELAGRDCRGVEVDRVGALWRARRPSHPGLAAHLTERAGYWEAVAQPYRVRLVPMPRVVMMINLGRPFTDFHRPGVAGSATGRIGSVVAGLADGPEECEHPGGKEAIRLEFTPLGAYRLLARPMAELTNRVVGLAEVLGPRGEELVERLAATRSWSARFDLLDRALLDRLAGATCPAWQVERAWGLLAGSGGRSPVSRVAAEVGWSPGHLTRVFTRQVGLAPKKAARVLRLDRTVRVLSAGAPSLAAAAVQCGFTDQSHLTHELGALAGLTPGALLVTGRSGPDLDL
ncbi:AraC family transcriptional regulator [Kitasatospora sp. NPDC002227]|uniref:AraC family transcriptional regulator n=1 Tax=Kitasatospora sp. NPDC002227 TaxID=3154773 RepID=UPI003325F381